MKKRKKKIRTNIEERMRMERSSSSKRGENVLPFRTANFFRWSRKRPLFQLKIFSN